MLLMIDNYDSFTYNLVHYFQALGVEVHTYRNDEITLEQVVELKPSYIVISPGPCTPKQSGVSLEIIRQLSPKLPILGVCLGHQSIAEVFGGKVVKASTIMHGKTSPIHHNNEGIFKNLPSPFTATRYHSLLVEKNTLPNCFAITAHCVDPDNDDSVIMGIQHKTLPLEGVQFHPESILTEHGHRLLKNFLESYAA